VFSPGDVIIFWSEGAQKPKFHLCVSLNGCYLFLNTPKKPYPGDFSIPCTELPFLEPTASGESIISCNMVIRMSDDDLRRYRAKRKGSLGVGVLHQLIVFIENTTVLSQTDKDELLDGLGGWV
jgi:hypothetical protein